MIVLQTNDAGAFFRFNDFYSKIVGGQLTLALEPPSPEAGAKEGLINVRDFSIRGEASLDRVAGAARPAARAWWLRHCAPSSPGRAVSSRSATASSRYGYRRHDRESSIDSVTNQVRMSGTFVPMYGLNNMFGQIPVLGLFLGGGSNEGLIGVTYEVVGTPAQPVLRVNPISAMAPGVLRRMFNSIPANRTPRSNSRRIIEGRAACYRSRSATITSTITAATSNHAPLRSCLLEMTATATSRPIPISVYITAIPVRENPQAVQTLEPFRF